MHCLALRAESECGIRCSTRYLQRFPRFSCFPALKTELNLETRKIVYTYEKRRAYEKGCLAYATEMEEYFNGINKKISKINERLIKKEPVNKKDLEYIQKEGFDHQLDMLSTPLYNSFYLHLDSENYKDLGILCESFSVERVKEALRYINKHIPNPYEWKNFGALVRTILRNKLNLEEIVSLFNPA